MSVLVADDYVGAVMSDLSTRRGRVTGTEPVGTGRPWCAPRCPKLEVTRYAIDLRSLSHGTGTFSRQHLRYEPMPSHVAAAAGEFRVYSLSGLTLEPWCSQSSPY